MFVRRWFERGSVGTIKLVVSLVLLTVLAWQIDYGEAKALFAQVEQRAWLLVFGLGLLVAQVLITVVRWQMVLKSAGSAAHLHDVARAAVYGGLGNSVLMFGNLLVRPVMLAQSGVPVTQIISSTLFERLLVLAVMVVLSVPGTLFLLQTSSFHQLAEPTHLLEIGLIVAVLVALAVLILPNRETLQRRLGPVWRVICELGAYFRHRWVFALALVLTVVSQLAIVFSAVLISQAAGLDLQPELLWLVLPPMMLIAALPLSMGGWGTRELAFVLLFREIGISLSAAMAVSVMLGLLTILALVICAVGLALVRRPL